MKDEGMVIFGEEQPGASSIVKMNQISKPMEKIFQARIRRQKQKLKKKKLKLMEKELVDEKTGPKIRELSKKDREIIRKKVKEKYTSDLEVQRFNEIRRDHRRYLREMISYPKIQ
ncbi:MAG: hypothetical protein Ta2E_10150 [Mycoplasmoidaceae bacterium]|nr:MAG: hypothetical protein Ta2E_10150 [Mycoplasmoidaceae bacterium]